MNEAYLCFYECFTYILRTVSKLIPGLVFTGYYWLFSETIFTSYKQCKYKH